MDGLDYLQTNTNRERKRKKKRQRERESEYEGKFVFAAPNMISLRCEGSKIPSKISPTKMRACVRQTLADWTPLCIASRGEKS